VARTRATLILVLVSGCAGGAPKVDPEKARGYFNEGRTAQGKEEHEEAVGAFTNAIKYNPAFADAYYFRAWSWLQMRKMENPPKPMRELVDRAFADYSAAVHANPTFADAYFSRAMLFCSRANYHSAVADLLVCARYKPKDPEPHLILGQIYEEKFENQIVLAMKHYEEYTKLGGTNETVRQKVALYKQLTAKQDVPKKEPTAEDEKKAQELHEKFKQLYPTDEAEAFKAIEELVTKYNHTKYFKRSAGPLTALYNGLKEKRGEKK